MKAAIEKSVRVVLLACVLGLTLAWPAASRAESPPRPDAVTPDGGRYYGPLVDGRLHGRGRIEWDSGARYEGDFANGQFSGRGEADYGDGRKYRGEFVRGRYHGKGRFDGPDGDVYEGDFEGNEFTGAGTYTRKDGAQYRGGFLKWRFHGTGVYTDSEGNVYEGGFASGELIGTGRLTGKNGGIYEGAFRQWRFHGEGVLRLPNGDVYKGAFARGFYEGAGTLTYARPRPDGRTQDSGVWRFGALVSEQQQARVNVETALYNQRRLLDQALASLAPAEPGKINMYLLAIAGDGSQEVFRREVEFVRDQFSRRFGTRGRSLLLINSRNTVAMAPMATVTSIRDSLKAIATLMDRERDILFLFLTSHGSKEHELTLNQSSMELRGLSARELAGLLDESRIRWKVVVVSACYGGGFLEPIRNDHTLVITAARHDRQSFGCADDNDFTYFGRAYFKEALPQSRSFQDAFHRAQTLIREWEDKDLKAGDRTGADAFFSLPQIHEAPQIAEHLQRWWTQHAGERAGSR